MKGNLQGGREASYQKSELAVSALQNVQAIHHKTLKRGITRREALESMTFPAKSLAIPFTELLCVTVFLSANACFVWYPKCDVISPMRMKGSDLPIWVIFLKAFLGKLTAPPPRRPPATGRPFTMPPAGRLSTADGATLPALNNWSAKVTIWRFVWCLLTAPFAFCW